MFIMSCVSNSNLSLHIFLSQYLFCVLAHFSTSICVLNLVDQDLILTPWASLLLLVPGRVYVSVCACVSVPPEATLLPSADEARFSDSGEMECGGKKALHNSFFSLTGSGEDHPPLLPTFLVCRLFFVFLLFFAFLVHKAEAREIQFSVSLLSCSYVPICPCSF